MPAFKDANGKEWIVKLDGPKVVEVRKIFNLDMAATDGSTAQRLRNDIILMIDVLWVICRSQAGPITDRQFGEALVGDAIEAATEAMIEAINDFFPSHLREKIKRIHAEQKVMTEKALDSLMAEMTDPNLQEQILAGMKTRMKAEIDKMLTQLSSASSSPEPSESAPTG